VVDFDFGVDHMIYLCKQCQFPWLISNVFDGENPLGNAAQTHVLTSSNGIKIGLMGLVEKYPPDLLLSNAFSHGREWLDTINSLPPNLRFVEPSDIVRELAPMLRGHGAEIVIALSHMVFSFL